MPMDVSRLPSVLPISVPRTKPDGTPTTNQMNWEFDTREWFKNSAVDLDDRQTETENELILARGDDVTLAARISRTETVVGDEDAGLIGAVNDVTTEVETARGTFETLGGRVSNIQTVLGDTTKGVVKAVNALTTEVTNAREGKVSLLAHVNDIQQAIVDGDDAIAEKVTTVETRANDVSASGRMAFLSNNGGASFDLYMSATVGGKKTLAGMSIIAPGTGQSAISFTANRFQLYDPSLGTNRAVFAYSGGVFQFNVPVRIDTEDLAANAATNAEGTVTDTGSGSTASCSITVKAGSSIVVTVSGTVYDTTTERTEIDAVAGYRRVHAINLNNGAWQSALAYDQLIALFYDPNAGGTGVGGMKYISAAGNFSFTARIAPTLAGTYTVGVVNGATGNMRIAITATELKR